MAACECDEAVRNRKRRTPEDATTTDADGATVCRFCWEVV